MKVQVRFFGYTAEVTGCREREFEIDPPTVANVAEQIGEAFPKLKNALDRQIRFAVGTEYAEKESSIKDGDIVSLIPPVGGG